MISRNEFLYLQVQIDKLKENLFDFEFKSPLHKKYEAYMSLGQEQKAKLRQDWDRYYELSTETEMYKLFLKAGKTEDVAKLKELGRQAREYDGPFLKKPSSVDPNELMQTMKMYFEKKKKLAEMDAIYEEHLPVYGKRAEKDETL